MKQFFSLLILIIIIYNYGFAQNSLIKEDEIQTPMYYAVFVKDLNKSKEWYCNIFELERLGGSEDEDGKWEIMNLHNEKLLLELIQHDNVTIEDRSLGYFKIGFQVPDVEVIANRFPKSERPDVLDFDRFNIRIIQIRDPDGNIIQLSSPL